MNKKGFLGLMMDGLAMAGANEIARSDPKAAREIIDDVMSRR